MMTVQLGIVPFQVKLLMGSPTFQPLTKVVFYPLLSYIFSTLKFGAIISTISS
jgi:hypothetical protein